MSVDSARRDIQRHQGEITKLQQEKAREASHAADELKKANDAASAAAHTSSESTRPSKAADHERATKRAAEHQKKIGSLEGKIAEQHKRVAEAERRMAVEQDRESRRAASDAQQAERSRARQMQRIEGTLDRHDELHAVALAAIATMQHLPERITVLFLAANPRDQQPLRLDEEARSIRERLQATLHRDQIRLETRWAVRPLDVLNAMNECEPRVVHFSGHGSATDEIVFQGDDGRSRTVSLDAIVQTIAVSGDVQLVFFNTCYSRNQAEAVVQHVAAAIGMNTSIGDAAARTFSTAFYSAIGFGRSVAQSFQQAKAALMLEGIPEQSTPELFVTSGLDADQLFLVSRDTA